jgi:hypothetical protein
MTRERPILKLPKSLTTFAIYFRAYVTTHWQLCMNKRIPLVVQGERQ